MVTFTVMTFPTLKTDKLQNAKFSKLLKEKIILKAIYSASWDLLKTKVAYLIISEDPTGVLCV